MMNNYVNIRIYKDDALVALIQKMKENDHNLFP